MTEKIAAARDTIHATTVAIGGKGVVITGPPGAGKSDLALRLIDRGARLVSDDYSVIELNGNQLIASSPPTIAGHIEVRGLGIITIDALATCPVDLIVALDLTPQRMPLAQITREILGIAVRVLPLSGFAASAPLVIEYALTHPIVE